MKVETNPLFAEEEAMPLPPSQTRYTPEQYLALERKADDKSEYVNGMIIALAGARRSHSLVVFNRARGLGPQLVGRPCEAYMSDMRVKVSPTGFTPTLM